MPADPKRVKEVFLEAAEMQDEVARAAFLVRVCGGDLGLRGRVEALLRSHEPDGSFLGTPAAVVPDPDAAATRAFSPDPNHAETRTSNGSSDSPDDEIPLGFLAPATRPDSLGRIGHYEVLEVLGQGGFGIVFRAFDDVLHRVVAVKVLAPQLAATSPARKRFLREARTSAQVRHENVVQVYEVGEDPLPYIAMEFIPGETLQQRLNRVGPVDGIEVLRIGRQVAEGLAAAHAQDLIHRDIKPGNILLEAGAGRVKITDFGLARAADDASISQSGIIAGTPMYMAPEQAKGEKLDQRADLFSLGSVLYQMAAGRPPFRANSTVAVLKRVAEDTPRDIREIIPETPQWLCDIIAKLHAKNPDERFQFAREVADLLGDCEAQLKENAKLKDYSRIPQSIQPAARRSGQWKWAVAIALLLPMLALAMTEFAGVTHLFRGPTAEGVVAESGQTARPGDPPLPIRVALEFDGIKDHVATPLHYDGSTPLTIETTVQISEWPVNKKHYHAEIVGCTEQAGFGLGTSKEGFYLSAFIGTNYATIYSTPEDRYLNRPIKLAGVIDDKALRLFIDGKQVARSGFEHDFKPSKEPISLGTSPGSGKPNDGGGYDWPGKMFEVRISKTARYKSDYDASALLTADSNTLVLYRCDEGAGEILHDTSGNERHGKIIRAKWVKTGGPVIGSPTVPPSVPQQPTFTNSIGMEFVKVPKGNSWLGGGKDKLGDREVEIPADFYLGKYEVTQEEWEKVMGVNPSAFKRGHDAVKDISDTDLKRFPVEQVSWDQCQVFVAKLNQREKEIGWVYRLPTEVEWEFACRGGPMADKADSAFDFYFAKPTNSLSVKQANFNFGEGLRRTCKVGSYEANRLGLFDMHGNVWEWCDDAANSAGGVSTRRTRSGGWQGNVDDCLAANRGSDTPSYIHYHLGLRLARVPVGVASPEAKSSPLAVAPFTDAEVKRIAALPAAEQVEEVRKELMHRNPGFDGKLETKIEDGVVTEFKIVTDIAPIRVFNALRVLKCNGTWNGSPKGLLEDLTPLAGMKLANLTSLDLACTKVTDAGMVHFKNCNRLTDLVLEYTQVGDTGVACFKDCKNLTRLNLAGTRVSDAGLAPFEGCDGLLTLALWDTRVGDAGLAHFKGSMKLERLYMGRTQVGDVGLAQFKSMPLRGLSIDATAITDLTPLEGLAMEDFRLTPKNITKGLNTLRDMKSLNTIAVDLGQDLPAAEFWERYDKGEFGKAVAPFTDADAKRIAALPAAEQVEEVRKELMRRNAGFDGKVEHKIEDGAVTEFKIVTDKVTDIAPIRVFDALRVLDLGATATEARPNGRLADLTPLGAMNLSGLTMLSLANTRIDDTGLAHVKDCKNLEILWLNCTPVTNAGVARFKDCKNLKSLTLNGTRVDDAGLVHFKDCKNLTGVDLGGLAITDAGLAHFKDCKRLTHLVLYETRVSDAGLTEFRDCEDLTFLHLQKTGVSDDGLNHFKDCKKLTWVNLSETKATDAGLAHFKNIPLTSLWIDGTAVTDLSPLRGMPLEDIRLTPKNITKSLDILRDMKSLKTIGIDDKQAWPAAEFWERYDKK